MVNLVEGDVGEAPAPDLVVGSVERPASLLLDLTEEYLTEYAEPTYASTRARYLAFARAYLTNGRNGAAAARTAGYSAHCAATQASYLLRIPHIQRLIRNLAGEELAIVTEGEELVKSHLTQVAGANLLDYIIVNDQGEPKLDLLSLTREQGAAIQSIKINRAGEMEIKLKDSVRAAELLGKHHKMFTETHEFTGKDGAPLVPPVINISFVEAPKTDET